MNYQQEELNQILMTKDLNEFYFAILERREQALTESEYEQIFNAGNNIFTDATKEEILDFENDLEECFLGKGKEIMKGLIGLIARIRQFSIITMIDDNIYDIASQEFIDSRIKKIIRYDNINKYYNATNIFIRLVTPEELPILKETSALLDTMDETPVNEYQKMYINQPENTDLTAEFINEFKGKTYKLTK